MTRPWRLIPLIALVLSGCGTRHVWQDAGEIVPSTYTIVEDQAVSRSIGRLRRLILLPAEMRYTGQGPVLASMGSEATPNRLLDEFAGQAADYLVHVKGYDLAKPLAGASAPSSKATYEATKAHVGALLRWAAESPDGAEPPDNVIAGAKTLGGKANVDGILLLQGWGKALSDEAFLTIIGTAGLAWPLIYADTKVSLSADLYEVSSGRIVWRSRATSNNEHRLHDLRILVWDLLEPIEEALPGIFVAQ